MLQHGTPAPLDPARVVILGGTGFIGRALGDQLVGRRTPTVALSSRELDLTSLDTAERLAGMLRAEDALVFASAITREKGRDAATMLRNLTMAERVSSALERSPCSHVVYLSSDAVYGDNAPNPVSEATPCDPADLYGLMHLVRERIIQSACGTLQVPLAILRPSIVYGPGDTHGSYGPNRFFRTAREGKGITLFGAGEERRDHVFIADVVSLVVSVLRRRSEGVLNLASGTSLSFVDVAAALTAVAGVSEVRSQPRVVPVRHREYDVIALRTAFPQFVPTQLEDGLSRTWSELSA